ncbi:MAG: hypothetical protein RR914_00985 [Oscillospiraceae bacterium]
MNLTKVRDNNCLKTAVLVLSIIGAISATDMSVMYILFLGVNPNLYKAITINVLAAVALVLIAMSIKAYNPKILKVIAVIKCGAFLFSIIATLFNFTFVFSGVFGIVIDILSLACLVGTVYFLMNKNPWFASYSILTFCTLTLLLSLINLVTDTVAAPSGILSYLITFIIGVAFNIIPIAFVFLPYESLENFKKD